MDPIGSCWFVYYCLKKKMCLPLSQSFLLLVPCRPPPFGASPRALPCLSLPPPPPRWLILGPARSGSSFHVDPNNTSAWNAVVTGAKKWILYPPTCIPPGVHPSADGADVATPVSLTEWFLNFYQETKEGKVGGAGD